MCTCNFILTLLLSVLVSSQSIKNQTSKPTIRIGIAAALKTQPFSIGWAYSGGAVPLALQYLESHGHLNNFNFEFHVEFTECDLSSTVSAGINFMKILDYDVVIGPPCARALKMMGTLGSIYRKPVLGWGFVSESDLSDMTRFPYVATVLPNSQTLGTATSQLLELYKWDHVALLYYKNELNYCESVIDEVESSLNDPGGYLVRIVMKEALDVAKNDTTVSVLQSIKSRARIVLFCAQTGIEKRDYLIKIAQLGLSTNEYVHVMLSMRSAGYGVQTSVGKKTFSQSGLVPVWEAFTEASDGMETLARSGASKMLVLDLSSEVQDKAYLQYMTKNIVYAVRAPPLSCTAPECLAANSTGMAAYARHLFDIFYLYGLALSKLNSTDPSVYQNWSNITPQFSTTFEGMTGEVQLNDDLSRTPLYQLYGLDDEYDQVWLLNISLVNGTTKVSFGYTNESESVWHFWGGSRPLTIPVCGFLGKSCPLTLYEQYQILIFVSVLVSALIALAVFICMASMIRNRRAEQERVNSAWKIPIVKLRLPQRRRSTGRHRKSTLSLQSDGSERTEDTVMSEFNENYTVQFFENEVVLTTKHSSQELSKAEMEGLVKLRELDHENLNKFIGLSVDGSQFIAVWKLCSRGSLQDILSEGNFSMDYFFKFCMIRDVAEGMDYLHHSYLGVHGNLRSATCLVNDSWQVKLADYGLDMLRHDEEARLSQKRLLWAAPEVLRDSLTPRNMKPSADVYSFAIIASEILTKKEAWNLPERKEGFEEVIYAVKKGQSPMLRPDLQADVEVNPTLIALVKDCWAEEPGERPTSEEICKLLSEWAPKTQNNLMDHVFKMLEEYTVTLEEEVEARTKELAIEKRKSDSLLSRMLPKQVAERLKAGQTVEPESFDSVSVFFSDLAKFTDLAAKCSPYQTVNLLNDVFSNFDAIIEKFDVYKVESIGDGFLCVSGLPIRNGFEHIKHVVDMSLQFMDFCKNFKVPHLPKEQVQLRIGINSGPCVAGVVGLSMPRYCLFGDTVNTASRMESNGKPSLIHMSEAAYMLLSTYYPRNYETISRGDVIIKGKGVMETFWVLGTAGEVHESISNRSISSDNVWKPTKTASYSDSPHDPRFRSVSPYMESASNDDENMRIQFRREMMKVV